MKVQSSGAVPRIVRRGLSVVRRGPVSADPTETLDDLDGAREAAMSRRERREARREHQRAVRRARNRARLRRAGQEIPPELREPGDEPPEAESEEEPEPEEAPTDDPEDDDPDPEIEPRAEAKTEAKMRRGPVEDKMLRPHEVGVEDKEEGDAPQGLDSVEFGSPAARELAESWGLSAEDFEDDEPSGATGFVKADVERIIGDHEPMGP